MEKEEGQKESQESEAKMNKEDVLRLANKDPDNFWNLSLGRRKITFNHARYTLARNGMIGGVNVWCRGERIHLKMHKGKWVPTDN